MDSQYTAEDDFWLSAPRLSRQPVKFRTGPEGDDPTDLLDNRDLSAEEVAELLAFVR